MLVPPSPPFLTEHQADSESDEHCGHYDIVFQFRTGLVRSRTKPSLPGLRGGARSNRRGWGLFNIFDAVCAATILQECGTIYALREYSVGGGCDGSILGRNLIDSMRSESSPDQEIAEIHGGTFRYQTVRTPGQEELMIVLKRYPTWFRTRYKECECRLERFTSTAH